MTEGLGGSSPSSSATLEGCFLFGNLHREQPFSFCAASAAQLHKLLHIIRKGVDMAYLYRRDSAWSVAYKEGPTLRRLSLGHCTKPEARATLHKYQALEFNSRHDTAIRTVDISFCDALQDFITNVIPQGNQCINSKGREITSLSMLLQWAKDIKTFKDAATIPLWFEERKDNAAKTQQHDRRAVAKFYRWAISKGFATSDPTTQIVVKKVQRKQPRYFTRDELHSILAAAEQPYRDAFAFLANTGLRSGELANLKWLHWDRQNRSIVVPVIEGDRHRRICGCKTKREGNVPLNAAATEILERQPVYEHGYIFANDARRQLDNDNCYRNLQRVLKRLGIKGTVHSFRHTTASLMIQNGTPLYSVKSILRHSSITTTEVYAHLSQDNLRKAVSAIEI